MKHTLKKILAVILAAATLLCCAPLSGLAEIDLPDISKLFVSKAKAVEASDLPEDFDLPLYNVSRIFSDSNNVGGSLKTFSENFINLSLAKKVYNAAAENAGFVASIEAWEAIRLVSNPSNLAEYLKYQQQYEEVIFAVLFSALKNEKFEEFSYSNGISKITSLTNKIITSGKNAELLDKTSLDGTERKELIDTAFAFLTEGKDVESKWSALGEYTDIVNKYNSIVDDIAEGIVSAINIIDSVSMYVSMLDAGAEVLSYLNALKAKAPNSVFGGAVQTVINTISKEWLGVVKKTIIDVGFVFGIPATEKLIDYAWTGCSAMCPFLGGMTIGEAAGTIACNLLFATEDTIEQYEYLKILTQLETAACALYDGYFNSCKSSVNRDNAAMLMFACDFSHALYGVATEASVEMMNILCNKGIVNTVINIFNNKYKQTFDEFEEASNTLLNAEKNVYNMIKSFWKTCIEEDYPEYFGVLEEENITPKYINSVDIEKDEVVFRVGDAMYFKWNINPINHEGEIGLKSDNEAVIKSREPMGILPLALEENIGTANVTIYSVDNPEICDTIKITVIGENDEGTTEAEQAIVSGTCGSNLTWTINKNTGRLVISGTGEMDNWRYTSDVPWYDYIYDIKRVIICDGVTNIVKNAFSTCGSLINITIPNSVTSICDAAFRGCGSLESITLPNGITNIGDYMFNSCASLLNVTIPNGVMSIGVSAFSDCDGLTNIVIPDSVTTIGDSVFEGCQNLKTVTIGNKVSNIADSMFKYCFSLTNVTIPDSVTSIGIDAFEYCGLTNITIPDSVTNIGAAAFKGCSSLACIILPNRISNIGDSMFLECRSLSNVTIPNSVTRIGSRAFEGCSIKSIEIPENVESIGYSAFYGCSNLRIINLPPKKIKISATCFSKTAFFLDEKNWEDGALYIGSHLVFKRNTSLEYTIKPGTLTIASEAFWTCEDLEKLFIPDSIVYIGADNFGTGEWDCAPSYVDFIGDLSKWCYIEFSNYGSTPLTGYNENYNKGNVDLYNNGVLVTEINIPDGLTEISDYAFCSNKSLTKITIPDSVCNIGKYAFASCGYYSDESNWDNEGCLYINNHLIVGRGTDEYIVKDGTKTIAENAFESSGHSSVIIPDSVCNIGVNAFSRCTNLTNVKLSSQIKEIANGTFSGCGNLKSITIPDSVTSIGDHAFSDCGLINITIPDSVTCIGRKVFYNCDGLNNIVIPDSVITLGDYVFEDCDGFTNITIPNSIISMGESIFYCCDNLTSVSIDNGITKITKSMFCDCDRLTNITIPESITSIGAGAFNHCYSMKNIYYSGTQKQWECILINSDLNGATIHYGYGSDLHTHSYVSSITLYATCTKTGIVTYTCDCGDSYIESIPLTEHTSGTWQVVIAATTETTGKKIKKCTVCGETLAEETIAKLPKEPIKDNTVVSSPSTATISYGDSILLHVDASKIPEGGRVKWTASNNNFSWSADGDTCKISPKSSGDTTFTATIYDAEGNPVSIDEQTMTSKAGFFDKIIAFFKSLFGLTKTYENVYKGIIR